MTPADEATVEAVAKSLHKARRKTDGWVPWRGLADWAKARYRLEAFAAITAYESARGDGTNAQVPGIELAVKPSPEKALEVVRAIEWACTEGRQYGGLDEDAAVADVLALWPGRSEREVKAEALREAAPAMDCEADYKRLRTRADHIEKGASHE